MIIQPIISSISVLFGALVGGYISRKTKQLEWKSQFYDQHIISPIIGYIDNLLEVIAKIYRDELAGKSVTENAQKQKQLFEQYADKRSWIKAQVISLGSHELTNSYKELGKKTTKFMSYVHEGELDKASIKKDELEEAAAIFLKLLGDEVSLKTDSRMLRFWNSITVKNRL